MEQELNPNDEKNPTTENEHQPEHKGRYSEEYPDATYNQSYKRYNYESYEKESLSRQEQKFYTKESDGGFLQGIAEEESQFLPNQKNPEQNIDYQQDSFKTLDNHENLENLEMGNKISGDFMPTDLASEQFQKESIHKREQLSRIRKELKKKREEKKLKDLNRIEKLEAMEPSRTQEDILLDQNYYDRHQEDGFGSLQGQEDGFGSLRGQEDGFGSLRGQEDGFGSLRGQEDGFGSLRGQEDVFGSLQGQEDGFGSLQGQEDSYTSFQKEGQEVLEHILPRNRLKDNYLSTTNFATRGQEDMHVSDSGSRQSKLHDLVEDDAVMNMNKMRGQENRYEGRLQSQEQITREENFSFSKVQQREDQQLHLKRGGQVYNSEPVLCRNSQLRAKQPTQENQTSQQFHLIQGEQLRQSQDSPPPKVIQISSETGNIKDAVNSVINKSSKSINSNGSNQLRRLMAEAAQKQLSGFEDSKASSSLEIRGQKDWYGLANVGGQETVLNMVRPRGQEASSKDIQDQIRNMNAKPIKPKVIKSAKNTSSNYNRIAIESYFKNKPKPTEGEIVHFVQCTKVPVESVREYLDLRAKTEEITAQPQPEKGQNPNRLQGLQNNVLLPFSDISMAPTNSRLVGVLQNNQILQNTALLTNHNTPPMPKFSNPQTVALANPSNVLAKQLNSRRITQQALQKKDLPTLQPRLQPQPSQNPKHLVQTSLQPNLQPQPSLQPKLQLQPNLLPKIQSQYQLNPQISQQQISFQQSNQPQKPSQQTSLLQKPTQQPSLLQKPTQQPNQLLQRVAHAVPNQVGSVANPLPLIHKPIPLIKHEPGTEVISSEVNNLLDPQDHPDHPDSYASPALTFCSYFYSSWPLTPTLPPPRPPSVSPSCSSRPPTPACPV